MTIETTRNVIDERLSPLFGEFVWHSVTLDPTLKEVSEAHYREVAGLINRYRAYMPPRPFVLEVGSYAHTTGYLLAQRLGVQPSLFDISASNLRLGRRLAQEEGLPVDSTRLVAGDFHQLPFEDGQFDFVFICSALHHTMRWQDVLNELIRVVAPGGFLLLQNEPLLRELCFYKFCTNRIENFTPFEKKLDELGIIRTVAQPYLGSRPERLFGMVENQHIPLDSLLNTLEQSCTTLDLSVSPEVCMGTLEREIMDHRGSEEAKIAGWLTTRLETLIAEASQCLGDTERGLCFTLPSSEEIAALSKQAARLLKTLPDPGHLDLERHIVSVKSILLTALRKTRDRLPSQLRGRFMSMVKHFGRSSHRMAQTIETVPRDSFREGLSRLFGAPVKIVAQKNGQPSAQAAGGRLTTSFPDSDGIIMGFDQAMLTLLCQDRTVIPDIQSAEPDKIRMTFPAPQWRLEISTDGIRSVVCEEATAQIHVKFPTTRSLVLLRVHANRINHPYRLALFSGKQELARQDVYQSEGFLLAGILESSPEDPSENIMIRAVSLDNTGSPVPQAQFALLYAGVLAI